MLSSEIIDDIRSTQYRGRQLLFSVNMDSEMDYKLNSRARMGAVRLAPGSRMVPDSNHFPCERYNGNIVNNDSSDDDSFDDVKDKKMKRKKDSYNSDSDDSDFEYERPKKKMVTAKDRDDKKPKDEKKSKSLFRFKSNKTQDQDPRNGPPNTKKGPQPGPPYPGNGPQPGPQHPINGPPPDNSVRVPNYENKMNGSSLWGMPSSGNNAMLAGNMLNDTKWRGSSCNTTVIGSGFCIHNILKDNVESWGPSLRSKLFIECRNRVGDGIIMKTNKVGSDMNTGSYLYAATRVMQLPKSRFVTEKLVEMGALRFYKQLYRDEKADTIYKELLREQYKGIVQEFCSNYENPEPITQMKFNFYNAYVFQGTKKRFKAESKKVADWVISGVKGQDATPIQNNSKINYKKIQQFKQTLYDRGLVLYTRIIDFCSTCELFVMHNYRGRTSNTHNMNYGNPLIMGWGAFPSSGESQLANLNMNRSEARKCIIENNSWYKKIREHCNELICLLIVIDSIQSLEMFALNGNKIEGREYLKKHFWKILILFILFIMIIVKVLVDIKKRRDKRIYEQLVENTEYNRRMKQQLITMPYEQDTDFVNDPLYDGMLI